jgi:hypothetical protein
MVSLAESLKAKCCGSRFDDATNSQECPVVLIVFNQIHSQILCGCTKVHSSRASKGLSGVLN